MRMMSLKNKLNIFDLYKNMFADREYITKVFSISLPFSQILKVQFTQVPDIKP